MLKQTSPFIIDLKVIRKISNLAKSQNAFSLPSTGEHDYVC